MHVSFGKTSLIVQITENNMKSDLEKMNDAVSALLVKRGILKYKTFKRKPKIVTGTPIQLYFLKIFQNQLWASHCKYKDSDRLFVSPTYDGFDVLNILSDDANLVKVFSDRGNREVFMADMTPKGLKGNPVWQELSYVILEYTSKGKGAGEFFFPIVAIDCHFIKTTVGKHDGLLNGLISEYKKDGASLTPYFKSMRTIDQAVKDVFDGNRPGPLNPNGKSKNQSFDNFREWLDSQSEKPEVLLAKFFDKLWPGQNVQTLIEKIKDEKDGQKFYNHVGQHVMSVYKDIDKFDQLIIIGKTKLVIIEDPTDLSMFKTIKFKWVTERGGDNQSLCDGYVNIKIE